MGNSLFIHQEVAVKPRRLRFGNTHHRVSPYRKGRKSRVGYGRFLAFSFGLVWMLLSVPSSDSGPPGLLKRLARVVRRRKADRVEASGDAVKEAGSGPSTDSDAGSAQEPPHRVGNDNSDDGPKAPRRRFGTGKTTAVVAAAVFAAAALLVGAAYAFDRSQNGKVVEGIRVGGIDIGGLDKKAARARLKRDLVRRVRAPVTVTFGSKTFEFDARKAAARVNLGATVADALERSRRGSLAGRVVRDLTGGTVRADITPTVTYSKAALGRWISAVAERIDRPAVDADIRFDGTMLKKVPAKVGYQLRSDDLASKIGAMLGRGDTSRTLKAMVRTERPKIRNRTQLGRLHETVLTVNRSAFRVTLWKRLKRFKSYTIAVGAAGFDSPAGTYRIQNKQVNPAWNVPKSDWAGKLAGKVIPPGDPMNPLIARWMGVFDGVGFHGTNDIGSLGSAGSHGCFRMAPSDVIDLYDRVPVGTPVMIV